MNELIERLEKAEAGSRELDAEIMFDLYAKPVGKREDGGPSGYLWPEDNPSWSFGIRFPGKNREWFKRPRRDHDETLLIERDGALVLMNALRIPRLTTSIDAALTLVPDGCEWLHKTAETMTVYHIPNADKDWAVHIDAKAATLPLALCIAALKARSQS